LQDYITKTYIQVQLTDYEINRREFSPRNVAFRRNRDTQGGKKLGKFYRKTFWHIPLQWETLTKQS